MKHFHAKQELGDDDVKYLIVERGDGLLVRFSEVEMEHDSAPLTQGIKLWLNRCKLLIDDNPVETSRVIIWHTVNRKASRIAGGHLHCFTNGEASLTVIDTDGENANLGLFNVWTSDNRRCYEFSGNSCISETVRNGNKLYAVRHGWSNETKPTMIFEVERTPRA
ncbi:MAG TPA: hypothetical protein PKE53_04920 [Flavobacteriales bacterium]|jgi:hypothetical protein|nr:hypothetical protein [Flavobacteriales bacterium]HMU13323.1 hypothetical protein [Flavobacteriales bacterium]